MRKSFLLALFSVSALFIEAAPKKPELERRVGEFVTPLIDNGVFSGVVLLARGDEVILNLPYGYANYEFAVPNTPQTRFAVASITKVFTGVLLRRLEQEKKLALSDPLAKYIPDFPSADKILLDHLRIHRSGLRDPDDLRRIIRMNFTTDEVVEHMAGKPLGSAPGEQYSYTTSNYALLANVIEKVTGQTFAEVMQRMIYTPARMADSGELTRTTVVPRLASGYMPDPYGDAISVSGPEDTSWKAGGGSSYSTTADLHRFARALYSGKLVPGKDPREVFATTTVLEKPALRASGGFPGFSANLIYFIDDEVTVVVLSNNYAPVTSWIADGVAAMYFEKPYENPTGPPKKLARTPSASEIVGRYQMGTFPPFSITLRSGRPFLAWNPVRVSALVPIDDDTWFEKLDWLTLKVERDSDGRVTGFTGTAPWSAQPMKVSPAE